MGRKHSYAARVTWTGDLGTGTSGYKDYARSYDVSSEGKSPIAGSSDPAFRGDRTRWNPEELLLAALASCHQLAYLHLCAEAGVIVLQYVDDSGGVMEQSPDGSGRFTQVTLKPHVVIAAGSDVQKAIALHEIAHEKCFIANSVNFPVTCEPSVDAG